MREGPVRLLNIQAKGLGGRVGSHIIVAGHSNFQVLHISRLGQCLQLTRPQFTVCALHLDSPTRSTETSQLSQGSPDEYASFTVRFCCICIRFLDGGYDARTSHTRA